MEDGVQRVVEKEVDIEIKCVHKNTSLLIAADTIIGNISTV